MLALFSAQRPSPRDILKAAQTLFASGLGLAAYAGPAALLRDDGAVLIANRAAAAVAVPLGLGAEGTLHPTLAGAIRTGDCMTVAITLDATADRPGAAGETYEFVVYPVVAGRTALVIGRDTALESAFRGALTESRQRYKVLVELCGDFCWETDAEGRFSFVSPGGALDYEAAELVGRLPAEFLDPALSGTVASPFATGTAFGAVDVWFRRADGGYACLETSSRPNAEVGGSGMRGVCRDVTADRHRHEELRRIQTRERLSAHIMRTIRDEIEPGRMLQAAAEATAQAAGAEGCRVFTDRGDGRLLAAASFGSRAPADEIVAGMLVRAGEDSRPFAAQQGSHGLLCVATSYRRAVNGALLLWRPASASGWSAEDTTLLADVAVQLGVAIQQIRNQRELEALSRTDGLTGLLNRRAFAAELEMRLTRGDRSAAGSLFYVDLDNFKPVNDLLGHRKGDEALAAVAAMLRDSTRPGDLVARLGGDEFALWLDRTDDRAAAQRARDLLARSHCLVPWSGDPARPLGISIGVAVWRPGLERDFDALAARADGAMYRAKQDGKNGFAVAPLPAGADDESRARISA